MDYTIHPIATIHTDFADKFGIPRQSGLVPELTARIVFEPEYRDPNALVGIEGYDRLWLIWQFSTVAAEYAAGKSWRPTVRPPRLGGNERRGVFATRSPYRPNALGLSCVELAGVENGELIVRAVETGGKVATTLTPGQRIPAGSSFTAKATLDPGRQEYGVVTDFVTIITNDPTRPMRRLRATAIVED